MLPHEIEPFADHHIAELEEVRQLLIQIHVYNETASGIPADVDIKEAMDKVSRAKSSLVRFKICMADEVRMKERLHEKNLNCRLHHKDQ